ncbi:signal peptidase I [Clostridium saccharoperbutylacetonicum]|uniref:signal peptidase I n=1 Tax=Clostridium saccharoperbutylacetonicum TaxID=36745 RepID=UPI0039EB117E
MNGNSKMLNLKQFVINNSEKNTDDESIRRSNKNFFKDWVIPIIAAIGVALLVHKFLFFNVEVMSGSLIPTLNVKDRLAVTRVYNTENLKEGDIIVFHSDEYKERLVKRLIGLPGDKIDIKDGVVFRNGEKLNEDYVKNKDNYNGSFQVTEGKYFFLGDNRPDSADSRRWNNPYIDASYIEGKVQFKFYPLEHFGSIN